MRYSSFICSIRARGYLLLIVCFALSTGLAKAQVHDGFQRRDGSMYVVRNGEARPMTRDVRLPNGNLITRDGFVVERSGKRTELADGAGCTLLGQPTNVTTQADGRLALATGRASQPAAGPPEEALLTQFQRWFNGPGRGKAKGHHKKPGKHKHKRDD
ncbi:DUF6799 domain-containing protein [Hymenobacter fodinae]|uniref:DUF6799 domain-containing protein n=1 Tax=Hymenobacter fodinae TaxID=2510796 RepID=A0A4Z0PBS7_9BACT|nr:DUF6799 domain-containing protein [Hymenobacter fodinae]TGE09703.1 hypothetical protein EU556_02390 [Hymenobacter fodinae]